MVDAQRIDKATAHTHIQYSKWRSESTNVKCSFLSADDDVADGRWQYSETDSHTQILKTGGINELLAHYD